MYLCTISNELSELTEVFEACNAVILQFVIHDRD